MNAQTPWSKFSRFTVDTPHGPLHVRRAGEGTPLLLLHGFPQTGHAFRLIAPVLSAEYDVIVPDLPGYGKSPGPAAQADGRPYDKRSVAKTVASMMSELGADQFLLVGHDRGARVAYRLAMDMPEHVTALVSLDVVPTAVVWETMDYRAAISAFHWPLLAQPEETVSAVLAAASDALIGQFLDTWAHYPLAPEARETYLAAYRRTSVQLGAAADYRAGAFVDIEVDRADRTAGKKIQAPMLVPYGMHYVSEDLAGDWADFAQNVRSVRLDSGHFLAEEAPDALLQELFTFFSAV